jgi:hypothetical protein
MSDLTLTEELVVLLTQEKGGLAGQMPDLMLAGAALAEFLLTGHARVEGEGRRAKIHEVSPPSTDHPFLGEVWTAMARLGFGRSGSRLLTRAASRRRTRVLQEKLAGDGVLTATQKHFLFFRWTSYRLTDPGAREAIADQLRKAIRQGGEVDDGASVLIALLNVSRAGKNTLGADFWKKNRKRIDEVAKGSGAATEAVRQAIEAVQTATLVVIAAGAGGSAGA